MFKRKIAFFYINDPNWIGGMDYVVNAVNSLSFLDETAQPDIEIIIDSNINQTQLKSRLVYHKYKFYVIPKKINQSIIAWIFNWMRWKFIYPFPKGKIYELLFKGVSENRKIYWIPDFQEEYFPHLFEEEVLLKRRKMRGALATQIKSNVVFSSHNALSDFKKFYGTNIKAQTKVLQFANPDNWVFDDTFVRTTLEKYNLKNNDFYICPNQMWVHKNHVIVLESLRQALEENENLKIVFCGKEFDPRNPSFADNLKSNAKDLVEMGKVYFLGFLPKNEQMCLIKESIALIQPSNFEGWSTTIEDGISLDKLIIANRLDVNVEQLMDKGKYFSCAKGLKNILLELHSDSRKKMLTVDYKNSVRVKEFAEKLLTLN